jgi:signal transduction histidine kinase
MVCIDSHEAPRHYEMRYNPLRDAEGQICGGYLFAYDITNRVLEQERLRQAEEALRQSQKMEAIGQLTGGIAHDFNNLLGGILGALELADKRLTQGRQQDSRQMLRIARQNTSRAAALVQRLLAFARQQTLMPQPVDVHHLVADMHGLIHSSLDAHIEFIDATLADQWLVRVDPTQLESTLLNLCINARDAMARGGTLRISTGNCPLDATQAAALQLAAGQYLHIQVQDSGCGMHQEVRERAVEPFFTTKPLGQGTGLGLSMAYGFVRQSAGQLSIESAPGRGTCVHLYLPREQSGRAARTSPARQMPGQSMLAARRLVLLVEDQPTLRLVIRETLEEQGFLVRDFEDGRAALLALAEGLRPALLVVDIGLPGDVDGYQVANANWAVDGRLPVLFITGYDGAIDNTRVASPHPMSLLHKPFELRQLSSRVEELLITVQAMP